jgi:hypothetical protein
MNNELIQKYITLRTLIGYLGEKSQYNWWDTNFLSPFGLQYLAINFPRSSFVAGMTSVSEAARRLHDSRIGKGGVYHLFRLPLAVEENLHIGLVEKCQKLDKLLDPARELKDLCEELLRLAKLPFKPNLNDGVMITAAPLWKLFRHRAWSNALKRCWKKMENGDYNWAHLAYSIWPEQVIPKCHKDRSLAIAHDLEEKLCDKIENSSDWQGNPKYKWKPKKLTREELQELIREKTRT